MLFISSAVIGSPDATAFIAGRVTVIELGLLAVAARPWAVASELLGLGRGQRGRRTRRGRGRDGGVEALQHAVAEDPRLVEVGDVKPDARRPVAFQSCSYESRQ